MVPHHVTTCTLCRLHRGQEPVDVENMNDAFFPFSLASRSICERGDRPSANEWGGSLLGVNERTQRRQENLELAHFSTLRGCLPT